MSFLDVAGDICTACHGEGVAILGDNEGHACGACDGTGVRQDGDQNA